MRARVCGLGSEKSSVFNDVLKEVMYGMEPFPGRRLAARRHPGALSSRTGLLPCSRLSALPSPAALFCTDFRSATPSPLSTTTEELDDGAGRLAAEEEEDEGPCLETPPAAPPTALWLPVACLDGLRWLPVAGLLE